MEIRLFHLVIAKVAGWQHRDQALVIDTLQEENKVLREQLGGLLRYYHREAA